MSLLIVTLSLIGYCLSLRRITRLPMESMPFMVISLMVLLLYLSAYLNILSSASLILICLGILFLLVFPFFLPKQKKLLFNDYITPGFVIFIFFSFLLGVFAYYGIAVGSDDYGRWLPFVKWTYYHHRFLIPLDGVDNSDYPPGGSLLSYFFLRIGGFSEGNMFFAQQWFLLSPLAILMKNYRWSEWTDAFIVFFIILFCLLFCFSIPLGPRATLMMDNPLAIFFGGMLTSYYFMENERLALAYLCIPAMAMVLLRPMAYGFAVLVGLIILIDQIVLKKFSKKTWLAILAYLSLIIMPLLILKSWQHYLTQFNASEKYSFNSVISLFKSQEWSRAKLTQFAELFKACLRDLRAAIPTLLCILSMVWIAYKLSSPAFRMRLLASHVVMFLCYIAYAAMLLIFFFYLFPEFGIQMHTYSRFIFVYLLGWFVLAYANLIQQTYPVSIYIKKLPIKLLIIEEPLSSYLEKFSLNIKNISVIILSIFLISKLIDKFHDDNKYYKISNGDQFIYHNAAKKLTDEIRKLTGDKANILMLSDNGVVYYVLLRALAYQFIPNPVTIQDASLRHSILSDNELKKFDYILMIKVKPAFWEKYDRQFSLSHSHLLMRQPFCTNQDFSFEYFRNCKLQNIPIYLYKIESKNGKIALNNLYHSIV